MSRRPVPGAVGGRPPRPPAIPPDPPDSDPRLAALLSEADQLLAVAHHDTAAASRLDAEGVSAGSLHVGGEEGSASLVERLIMLHAVEAARDTRSSNLNLASNLLDRLNSLEPLNRVVVQLWPGDDGYSLLLATTDGTETNLGVKLSYNDNHILECIDNEEIPVIISDLLEGVSVDMFYSGCVVAEVRDYRQVPPCSSATASGMSPGSGPSWGVTPPSRLVLLRPSTQSIICDSQALAKSVGQTKWTSDERNSLESQVVLATQSPLCLDPSPVVSLVANKANHARLKFNSQSLRRVAARRYSQAGINRKRKLEASAAPAELRIHDFIQNLNNGRLAGAAGTVAAKRKMTPVEALRRHQEATSAAAKQAEALLAGLVPPPANAMGCLNLVSPDLRLTLPSQVDVAKYVRPIGRRTDTNDMTPQVVEEYVLETAERGQARVYHTRLTILQRQANDEYIGELYVERDYKEDDNKGSTCRFLLGTRPHALRYINQFTEIFTEEGRKSVKITHRVPNQQPRITFTPGMRATMAAAGGPQAQAAILQRKNSGATAVVTASSSPSQVPGKAASVPSGPISIQLQPQQQSKQQQPTSATPTPLQVQIQQPPLLPPQSVVPSCIASKLPTTPLNPASIQVGTPIGGMGPASGIQVTGPGVTNIQVAGHNGSIQLGAPGSGISLSGPVAAPGSIQVTGGTPGNIQVTGATPSNIQVTGGPPGNIQVTGGAPGGIQVTGGPPGGIHVTGGTPGSIQVTLSGVPPQDNQQEAISAIVQSLMNAGAQFEQQKMMEEQTRNKAVVTPSSSVLTVNVGGGAAPVQVVSGAVLPTVPVPPASLVGQSSGLQVTQPSLSQLTGSPRLPPPPGRVTLQNLLSSGPPPTSTNSKVTISQLAAQLSRPVAANLPTYSQALAASHNQLAAGHTLAPGQQTSPRPAAGTRRPSDGPSPDLSTSCPPHTPPLPSPHLHHSAAPGLHALLADTPAADKPVSGASVMANSNSTLLERLVSGGSQPVSSLPSGSSLSQVATQLPTVPSQHAPANNPTPPADSNEITLAALLGNPPKSQPVATSPTKSVQMSPLLQQLQQPIQPVNPSRLYPSPGLTSPRQPTTPSPQPILTSPRHAPSPRPLQPVPSPRPPPSPRTSTLHHQLMQPPAPRYTIPTQSILSAQLSAPITPRSTTQSLLSQQLQQPPHNLLHQPPLIATHSSPSIVSVTLQDLNANNAVTNINSMNTVNGTVTVATPRPLATTAVQPGIVNLGGVQLQASPGQPVLVNQGTIPVQVSIPGHTQPITFSVNLPDHNQQHISNGSVAQAPVIVSSATSKVPHGSHAVTVSSVGKFVSNGPTPGTVVLQGPGGNIIQLPQQPAQPGQVGQFTSIKPAPQLASVVRTSGVMVRQPSPLLVQMPQTQPIQIVRSVPVNQPTINCGALQGVGQRTIASPSPQGPPTPQTPGVPPSPASVTSPQGVLPPDSPLVAVQLQNHAPDHTPHFLLSSNPKQAQLVPQQLLANNQPHLKIRQQRKQSLK